MSYNEIVSTVKHYHHHYHFSYTTSLKKQFATIAFVTFLLILILLALFHYLTPYKPLISTEQLSINQLILASAATIFRLTVAYFLALVFSVPLALLITGSPKTERFLLPFFDILQSIPVLAFFPVVVLIFIKINYFSGAAIFVLFMAMLWNLVFSMVGGLKTIPEDIQSAAFVFKSKGIKKLWHITLPAIFPYIVTGSLLAWAQGWNITIVAEVLHNYIPNGNPDQDLFGLGSLMVNANYQGKNIVFIGSLIMMIVLIGLINFFVWQKLIHLAQRYKFD